MKLPRERFLSLYTCTCTRHTILSCWSHSSLTSFNNKRWRKLLVNNMRSYIDCCVLYSRLSTSFLVLDNNGRLPFARRSLNRFFLLLLSTFFPVVCAVLRCAMYVMKHIFSQSSGEKYILLLWHFFFQWSITEMDDCLSSTKNWCLLPPFHLAHSLAKEKKKKKKVRCPLIPYIIRVCLWLCWILFLMPPSARSLARSRRCHS